MPATEATIAPKSAIAPKDSPNGSAVALPTEDAPEVERKYAAFEADFRPSDTLGRILVRIAATSSVRMERAVLQESAMLRKRVLQAQAEAAAKGEDPVQAGRLALFDPSKEACLARKYEAAAERSFFRAVKELLRHNRAAEAPSAARSEAQAARKSLEKLGSFLPAESSTSAPVATAAPKPAPAAKPATKPAPAASKTVIPAWKPVFGGSVDVPITIGRPR